MDAKNGDRDAEIARLRQMIESLHSPRLQMALIVGVTGSVGLFASFALLHLGVNALWLRYPVAVALAYAAFLFLLWCWLRLARDHLLEDLDVPVSDTGAFPPSGAGTREDVWRPGGGRSGGAGASASFGESPRTASSPEHASLSPLRDPSSMSDGTEFDAEDLAGIAAIVALAGAVGVAVWMTVAAPAFLAELLLDTALAAGLYRRVGGVEAGHWLRTAVRRTVWPCVCVALGFALAGALMQAYAPSANSIGQVIRHLVEGR